MGILIFASIDRKERRFVLSDKESLRFSAELVTQALGGVAPLPILQAVIGGIGDDVELAIQNQKEQISTVWLT